MDWRIFSSSATADDIADELLRENEVAKREIETKREKKFWPRPIERRDDSSYCGKSLGKADILGSLVICDSSLQTPRAHSLSSREQPPTAEYSLAILCPGKAAWPSTRVRGMYSLVS
jgi:hypothetical protein